MNFFKVICMLLALPLIILVSPLIIILTVALILHIGLGYWSEWFDEKIKDAKKVIK